MISQEHLPVLVVAVISALAIWYVYRDLQRVKELLDVDSAPAPRAAATQSAGAGDPQPPEPPAAGAKAPKAGEGRAKGGGQAATPSA
jgi:hypothetical protein